MKKLLTVFLIAISLNSYSQFVGINNPNPQQSLDVIGNGKFSGQVTVLSDKGILRSYDTTQNIYYFTKGSITVNGLLAFNVFTGNETLLFPVGLYTKAPRVYIGNIISGTGEYLKVMVHAINVTKDGCKLSYYNASNLPINFFLSVEVGVIGN